MITKLQFYILLVTMIVLNPANGQKLYENSQEIAEELLNDPQLKGAQIGICLLDIESGERLLDWNADMNFSPASVLKVLTSSSALNLLGSDFTYKTMVFTTGVISGDTLKGDLVLVSDGDPTFGSERFGRAKQGAFIINTLAEALKQKQITHVSGNLIIDSPEWDEVFLPGSTPYEDIANYYSGEARGFNYADNTMTCTLKQRPTIGDELEIIKVEPELDGVSIQSEVRSHASNRDMAYFYSAPGGSEMILRGSVPKGYNTFKVKANNPNPKQHFSQDLKMILTRTGISWTGELIPSRNQIKGLKTGELLIEFESPQLGEIVRVMNLESDNLIANALLRTMGKYGGKGSAYQDGVQAIELIWAMQGINMNRARVKDGSGLSRANGVSPVLLCEVLRKSKSEHKKILYESFKSIKNTTSVKCKSGYIEGVRSYSGFITLKDGRPCVFTLVANHFSCTPTQARLSLFSFMKIMENTQF